MTLAEPVVREAVAVTLNPPARPEEQNRLIADHAKRDITFEPTTAVETERWHVRAGGREFELLLRGQKFYDTRAKKGGGGAVDLVMHLFGVGFMDAVGILKRGGFD